MTGSRWLRWGILLALLWAPGVVDAGAKLGAVTVLTGDFARMLPFYRDVLGLEVIRVSGEYAELASGGFPLHLTTRQTMKDAIGHGRFAVEPAGQSFELSFEVESPAEVDAFYRRVVELGADAVKEPHDVPWGQRVAYFADPDGNIHDVFALLPKENE